MTGIFTNISAANQATHRTPIDSRIRGRVETTVDFRMVDSFMIFPAAAMRLA